LPCFEKQAWATWAKSGLWRRIVASALGVELVTVNSTEGAAYGAALLAGVGSGAWPDVPSACAATIAVTGRTAPDSAWSKIYSALHPIYRGLYPALRPTYEGLAQLPG
jgi:xylulokinase